MKKGYWIVRADVTDPEGYKAYVAANMAPIGKHGGRFLVRGGSFELFEGAARSRSVVRKQWRRTEIHPAGQTEPERNYPRGLIARSDLKS